VITIIYFNTINLTTNQTLATGVSAAINITSGVTTANSLDIRNNIFANSQTAGTRYAIYSGAAAAVYSNINYNNYYSTGSIGFLTSARATLANWQTATGKDVNSISADPQFQSATDLRPGAGNVVIGAGVTIAGITTDFPGTTRNNPPTIGAFEEGVDIVAPVIAYTALTGTCSTADRILSVTITDISGVATGGSAPRVYYSKNGGAYSSSAGVLALGTVTNGVWDFTIPSAGLGSLSANDVVSYYVVAQDIAGNIGSSPAGVTGGTVNAPVGTVAAPNSYTITPILNGTYTVGAGKEFPTLTAAVAAYNGGCVTGPVIFSLTDATYNAASGETFPIVINAIAAANATNTLTIKPATGVTATISGSAATNSIFRILGNFITIDGSNTTSGTTRDLTITNTSTTTPNVVLVGSSGTTSVTNIAVRNSIIINGVNTSSAIFTGDAATTGNPGYFSNITYQNNSIQRAYIGHLQQCGSGSWQRKWPRCFCKRYKYYWCKPGKNGRYLSSRC
jgi:hypothetical protein